MTTMYWLAFALGGAVGAMGRAGIAATLTAGRVFRGTLSHTSTMPFRGKLAAL